MFYILSQSNWKNGGKPTGSTHSSTRGLSPRAQLERQAEFHPPHRTRPDVENPPLRLASELGKQHGSWVVEK